MATPGQVAVAVFILLVIFVGLAILTYRQRYLNLNDEQVEHKELIESQIADTKPARWTIETELWGALETPEEKIAEMFSDGFESPGEETTIRDAYRSVKGSIASKAGPLTEIPRFSQWLAQEAFLLLVAGGIATLSIATLTDYLQATPDYPSTDAVISATQRVIDMGFEILLQFPYLSDVAAFAFAYVILVWQLLYDYWYVTGVFLLLGAVLIAVLHRDLHDDIETVIVDRNRRTAVGVVFGVLAVWTIGVIPAAAGKAVGLPRTGAAIGFIFAFLLTVTIVVVGVYLYAQKAIRRVRKRGVKFHGTLVYLLFRRVFGTVGILAAPIIAIYWFRVVYTGKLGDFMAAFTQAHLHTQALIALTLGLAIIGVSWAVRDAMPDIRDAASNLLADRAARAVMFGWGAPTGVFIFAFMFGAGFQISLPLALVVGVLAAIVSRLLWEAFLRVKYRAKVREKRDRIPKKIKISAMELHDADDEPIYLATVNGEKLAARSVEAVTDAIVRHADALQKGEDPPATFEEWYARDCTRFGTVDPDETALKLRRKIRRVTFGTLRKNNNRMRVQELKNRLDNFPESLYESLLREWEYRGSGEHSLHRRGDYYTSPQSVDGNSLIPFL